MVIIIDNVRFTVNISFIINLSSFLTCVLSVQNCARCTFVGMILTRSFEIFDKL